MSVIYDAMSDAKQARVRRRDDLSGNSQLRKSQRTRQAILDGALEFLWSHPFRDLSVTQLMSVTGISRSAFYQYFADLHELMEALLDGIKVDIFQVATPWFQGEGDPIPLLQESVLGLVRLCYKRGPILRAVADAAPMDERLENAWKGFLDEFDNAVADRIKQHQAAGVIGPLDAHPVAIALNRMNAFLLIHHFGSRPRGNQDSVRETINHIWLSTLYGDKALESLNS